MKLLGEGMQLIRELQSALAAQVREGGLAFEELRGRLGLAVDRHLADLGWPIRTGQAADEEKIWNALWRFVTTDLAPRRPAKTALSCLLGYLDETRLTTILGGEWDEPPPPAEVAYTMAIDAQYDQVTEAELWELVGRIQSSVQAFRRIMEAYHLALLRHILVGVHVPECDENDIAQLVWMAAWRKLAFEDTYDPSQSGLYCFLYTFLVRKEVAEVFRHLRRKQQLIEALHREWGSRWLTLRGSPRSTLTWRPQRTMVSPSCWHGLVNGFCPFCSTSEVTRMRSSPSLWVRRSTEHAEAVGSLRIWRWSNLNMGNSRSVPSLNPFLDNSVQRLSCPAALLKGSE